LRTVLARETSMNIAARGRERLDWRGRERAMSDSAQLNGSAQPAAPTNTPDGALPTEDQFQADAALLRLVIGYMLLGTDELRERLRRWDDTTHVTPMVEATPPQPAPASLGRALVGMAFETETRMRRGFSALLERVGRFADEANLAYTRLAFSARGTPLDGVRARLDELLFLSLTAMDRWAARGAIEERQGRRMAETSRLHVAQSRGAGADRAAKHGHG
jgi:hypothetical protein